MYVILYCIRMRKVYFSKDQIGNISESIQETILQHTEP